MWLNLVESTVNQHLLWITKWVKYDKQPEWMADDILQAISTRDKHVKDKDFENYKLQQNKVVSLIRNSKREYYIHMIEQSKGDRTLWTYIKELNPKDSGPAPDCLMDDEKKITDPAEIAEFFFNKPLFINMVTKYIKNENRGISEYDKLKTYIDSKVSSNAIVDISPIEDEFILKQLMDLDPKKDVGMDGLFSKLLKFAAPTMASSVTKVINLSIKASKFPTL